MIVTGTNWRADCWRCLVYWRAREMATQTANTYQINRAHHGIAVAYPQGTRRLDHGNSPRLHQVFWGRGEKRGTKGLRGARSWIRPANSGQMDDHYVLCK